MAGQRKTSRELERELAQAKHRISVLESSSREDRERASVRAEDLARLLDLVPVPIWIAHDSQCHLVTGNRAANALVGVEPDRNVSQTPPSGRSGPDRSPLPEWQGPGA